MFEHPPSQCEVSFAALRNQVVVAEGISHRWKYFKSENIRTFLASKFRQLYAEFTLILRASVSSRKSPLWRDEGSSV